MSLKKTGYEFWNDVLGSPRYVAAPMVDMSELSFRELCRRYDAQLCYSPMLHSQQFLQDILYRSDSFSTSTEDRPLIIQFCANEPSTFLDASLMVADKCDAIDLNLGCPQAIAKKGHYGAYLQDEWDLIHSIVRKAALNLPVPVTCKMRILSKPILRSVEYAKMLENAGCSVLTIHGRTRFQKGHDTGLASWDAIKEIKQNVKIPVISNGNILSYSDVQACLEYTGADAVMSAEGLLYNPALFSGTNPPVWEIAKEYLELAEKHKTPIRNVRSHMYRIAYLCLHQYHELRGMMENSSGFADFYHICEYLKNLPNEIVSEKCLSNKNEETSEKFCDLDFCDKPEFDLTDLFTNDLVVSSCDMNSLTNCDNFTSAVVNKNLSSSYKSESVNNQDLFSEEVQTVRSNKEKFFPVWLCHARPRIAPIGGTRGCYSKYFGDNAVCEAVCKGNNEGVYLSKKQRRRIRHYEKVLTAMKENRKMKKLRRKQKILELKGKEQCEAKPRSNENVNRKQEKQAIRQRLITAQGHAPKVCIDFAFSEQMSEKELNRMSSQLRRLYGSNRHAEKPFHVLFCNFSTSKPLYKICVSKNDGFSSYVVDMVEKSPENMFSQSELIYLSPDSDNVLTSLENTKVYVIGGIIDGSVKKGLTLDYAKHRSVQTARLPILEYLIRGKHKSGNTVLTVNQVFDILLKFYETGDWVQSLSFGIPRRKGFCPPETSVDSKAPTNDVPLEINSPSACELVSTSLSRGH